ncbi:MAG: acetate--CoA ligase family protein [Alphaproteobacteria bacterium]
MAARHAIGHRLSPLLTPRSIAFVGASTKPGSIGNNMIEEILAGGFTGEIYPVNPSYDSVEGVKCYPSLAALPKPVDHVVLAVANRRLEAQLAEAAAHGARAATIFASGHLEGDREPPLVERLAAIARDAGMEMCGGNCPGFFNFDANILVAAFPYTGHAEPGPITFITHSGSLMYPLVDSEERLGYNLVISSGQELVTTAADYLDYALDLPSTRVVALFLETIRDPRGFRAALEKARARHVPVVALKVGRTAQSAALAISHSGAIAGDDAAYQAVFEHHGVIRVHDIEEMVATLLLLSMERRVSSGGLAAILDSGGSREMLIDLADDVGMPFAQISAETRERLAQRLEYGLEPVNPLDAWGTGHDYEQIFVECFSALMDDPATAIGVFVTDHARKDVPKGYGGICEAVATRTAKPITIVTHHRGTDSNPRDAALTRAGIPVIDGVQKFLRALRHLFDYRDFCARPPAPPPAPVRATVTARWRKRLADEASLDEAEALALVADYGIPAVPARPVEDAGAAIAAAESLGYPVAVKTAMPGIAHKSERGGVRLNLPDAAAVEAAYTDLAGRLGPRAVVAAMAGPGVEMALGVVIDDQFGPLVMIGAGGVHVELLGDARFALPPFGAAEARRLIDGLRIRPLLDGGRGRPPADLDALVEALARLSVMAVDLGDVVREIDLNPFIVQSKGCAAVDALVVTAQPG